jgi:hypothetical protein
MARERRERGERENREEREEREKRKRRETRERDNREKREKRDKERQRVSATTLLRCATAVGRRDEKRFEQQRTIPCVHAW